MRIAVCFVLASLALGSQGVNYTVRETAGCGDDIIRGINTGGWFLMEPWITPKIFENVNVGDLVDKIIDEWTYAEYLDKDVYMENMINHWNTFYTREDFEKLQAVGISHIRVPISYWYWDVIEGEPFPTPNMDDTDETSPLFYIKRALTWMDELGLKANIDLHTGPGSQNGYDNSGRAGEIHWVDNTYPDNRFNVDRTVDILGQAFTTLQGWVDQGVIKQETLWGMGILNEPHICGWYEGGRYWPACRDDFYPKGYAKVREFFSEETAVNFDQAAKGYNEFEGFFPESDYKNVFMDSHVYQCFGGYWNEVALSGDGWNTHLSASCDFKGEISSSPLRTYVGEFSMSVTECTKYLKGYFTPYNPDDFDDSLCENFYTNDWSTYPDDYKEFIGKFFLAQIDGFEAGAGWFMWTGKTEDNAAPEWDFLFLVDQGVIPSDLCSRPTYC